MEFLTDTLQPIFHVLLFLFLQHSPHLQTCISALILASLLPTNEMPTCAGHCCCNEIFFTFLFPEQNYILADNIVKAGQNLLGNSIYVLFEVLNLFRMDITRANKMTSLYCRNKVEGLIHM